MWQEEGKLVGVRSSIVAFRKLETAKSVYYDCSLDRWLIAVVLIVHITSWPEEHFVAIPAPKDLEEIGMPGALYCVFWLSYGWHLILRSSVLPLPNIVFASPIFATCIIELTYLPSPAALYLHLLLLILLAIALAVAWTNYSRAKKNYEEKLGQLLSSIEQRFES